MPRTIIISPNPGQSLDSTLEGAIKILRSNRVLVDTSAQNPNGDGQPTATILLQYVDDKTRALRILANARFSVK